MTKASFILGKGTQVEIAMLPVGGDTEPVRATITTTNSTSSKDIDGSATITLSAALASGVTIPTGSFLGFVAPTSGKTVLVQLTADAKAGDSTLTVATIPEDIAASSVAKYPLKLSARKTANIGRSGKRETSVDFESGGFETGLTSSISQKLDFDGNYLPGDAGFATAEYAFLNLREVYYWVTLPKSSDSYTTGKIYKGFASITDLPLDVPADGIISGKISVACNGAPVIVPEVPTSPSPSPSPTP